MADSGTGTVIGAVITAVGTSVAAVIAGRYALKNAQIARDAELKLKASLEASGRTTGGLSDKVAERSLFKTSCVGYKAKINDINGSSTVYREWRGIKVTEAGFTLPHIPATAATDTPNGKFTAYPKLLKQPLNLGKYVSIKEVQRSDKVCSFHIMIDGSLTYDDPPLDCECTYQISNMFIMTQEEAEKVPGAMRNEFSHWMF